MIKTAVLGATGYAGIELVRILSAHPEADIKILGSQSFDGQPISEVYQNFSHVLELDCEKLDLDRVAEEYEIEIGSGDGDRNVVTVKPGMICVSSADCPEQICVNTGWASKDQPYPIVCMPHDLVIRIVGADGEADAEAR